jgi:hypothetical protein
MPQLHRGTLRGTFLFFSTMTALAAAGCTPVKPVDLRLAVGTGGEPPPAGPLVVAAPEEGDRREILVDARFVRTSLGRFHAGDRVQLHVLEGKWTFAAGGEMVGANGLSGTCRAPAPHVCAAGEDAAPGMGLILTTRADPRPSACAPSQRLFIPSGVEFAMPQDAFLFLGPNDWEDSVSDNTGSIQVEVETAASKSAQAFTKRRFDVLATQPRTPLGILSAGVYLRVSVLGGTWNQDFGAARVGPEGIAAEKCSGRGSHVCPAGDGRAPLMGLVLVMASCEDGGVPRATPDGKRFVGAAADFFVAEDGELLLGPNDWEDGCHDNAGALRVEIITTPVSRLR